MLPFIQAMAPTLALSGSALALAAAVIVKSALFAFFERRLSPHRAAWLMFLGNVLTSFVGALTAVMMGSGEAMFAGIPIVFFLSWLPSRRLVRAAPRPWLARQPPTAVAGLMTVALVASILLFAAGQGAIQARQLVLYWAIKLAAIFLALLASVTLTTIWEEWVVWRLSLNTEGASFSNLFSGQTCMSCCSS